MAKTFEETQDLLPRNAFVMLTAVLVATDIFLLMCSFIGSIGTPIWMFYVSSIVFAAIILFCFFLKLRIWIEDDVIHIRFLKRYDIPFSDIIDYKTGDVDIIRNYSGWGIKKGTFKNLISIGYDRGVSLKLMGRRVITISVSDPDEFVALLPKPEN